MIASLQFFLESGDCFDAAEHKPYAFVVRVETKIHIVNIACLLQLYACYAVKIYKKQSKRYFQTGGRARCAGPESVFV